jgi:hypothetical protein
MNVAETAATEIRELELSYAERVNMAVAEDRYDLVDRLVADFDAEIDRVQHAA